jgi:hypothetical protein
VIVIVIADRAARTVDPEVSVPGRAVRAVVRVVSTADLPVLAVDDRAVSVAVL